MAGCLPIAIQSSSLLFPLQGSCSSPSRCATRRSSVGSRTSRRPRPDQCLQPVRALSVRSDPSAVHRAFPRDRCLAAPHGRHHVVPDEAQSGAARSRAEDDFRLDAGDLHLHAVAILFRSRHLLGMEQHALGAPAVDHSCAAMAPRSNCSTICAPSCPRENGRRVSEAARCGLNGGAGCRRSPSHPVKSVPAAGCLHANGSSFRQRPRLLPLPAVRGDEIAFAGRSNVGKSSLINALTNRNGLARTSNTPGRTQELIFFRRRRRAYDRRHAGLWLCRGAQGQGRGLDGIDPRLSQGTREPQNASTCSSTPAAASAPPMTRC